MKLLGKVSLFNPKEQFGFIKVIDQDLEEVFVRTSDTKNNKPLEVGQIVEFELNRPEDLGSIDVKNVKVI